MTNETNNKWRFCVVGNIIGEHIDEDGNVYIGTKAFKKGTKVYINEKFFAEGQNDVWVIGLNRFKRYVMTTVPLESIENIRLQRVFSSKILEIINYDEKFEGAQWRLRTSRDKKEATTFIENWKRKNNPNIMNI